MNKKMKVAYAGLMTLAVLSVAIAPVSANSQLGTYLWAKYGTTDLPATLVFNFAYTYHNSVWLYALTLAGVISGGTAVLLGILLSL